MNLPSDETGSALRRLQDDGSDLSRPMKMDFFVAVPNENVGAAIAKEANEKGFECSVEKDDETNGWTCYAAKTFIPSYENVIGAERYLDSLAERLGGKLDGFGSYGNSGDQPQ